MKLFLLFNPKSGSQNESIKELNETVSRILSEIDGQKINIVFEDITTDDLSYEYFEKEKEIINAIVIAGGDGTISKNIEYADKCNIHLGIIPMGTFNNFASDNNIPTD